MKGYPGTGFKCHYCGKPGHAKGRCHTHYQKWRLKRPGRIATERWANLKSKYGITRTRYEELLETQGGGCAFCGRTRRLCVDHDHNTGRVRGILCTPCNFAISASERFGLDQIAKYLARYTP